jgi:tRNA 2-selenouridine synthase
MEKELRVDRLVSDYGTFSPEDLKKCIEKLTKRLGGVNTQLAIDSLDKGKPEEAAQISLNYYDKAYNFGLSRKKNSEIIKISLESIEADINANKILEILKGKSII